MLVTEAEPISLPVQSESIISEAQYTNVPNGPGLEDEVALGGF